MSLTYYTGIAGDRVRVYGRLLVCFSSALVLLFSLPMHAQSVPHSSHVVIVIEENTSYSTAVANMPWLVSQGNAYGHADNFTTNSGGSLLDYLWLSSGSCQTDDATCSPSTRPRNTTDFQCTGDSCAAGTTGVITDDNIFRELDRAGLSWKVYAESIPSTGWRNDGPYPYVWRHNPAIWYSDINNDGGKVVDFTGNFANDLANGTLPNYSVVVPNMLDDAHDGSPAQADTWLQNNIGPLLNQPYFQPGGDGLLIITFDNGDNDNPGQVYTALIGPRINRNFVSTVPYMHQNTLRTMLDALGINASPGATSGAADMSDFFSSGGGHGDTNIDDANNWSCTGNCQAKANDTGTSQDGSSARFTYTGGVFGSATWRAPLATDYSNAGEMSLDFLSFITNPTVSQALEVHAIQQVNGFFYPFKMQCDFQGSGLWRVYDPPTDTWVATNVNCVVFTANSWDHFTLHFHRSGTQLVYDDVAINGSTYPFNVTTNAIQQAGNNSMTAEVTLIGDGSGTAYSWWLDELSLTF